MTLMTTMTTNLGGRAEESLGRVGQAPPANWVVIIVTVVTLSLGANKIPRIAAGKQGDAGLYLLLSGGIVRLQKLTRRAVRGEKGIVSNLGSLSPPKNSREIFASEFTLRTGDNDEALGNVKSAFRS
jgi:hypothetical protein